MRKLLIVALVLSIAINVFLLYKYRYRAAGSFAKSYSYLSNPQFKEQTNIFQAYNSPCDVAFIGDSHIYKCHWSELLGIAACNRGIGSDITEGVYSRIQDVIHSQPKICFISAGSNDIDLNIHPDTTISYFKKIIAELQTSGVRPVIMEITSVAPGYPNSQFNDKAESLNKRLRGIAETISIHIEPADLQEDRIHLTASGYQKWKKAIGSIVKQPPQ